MDEKRKIIIISDRDNVAVALRDIGKGEEIDPCVSGLKAAVEIPRGHKVALADIAKNDKIIKYGFPIGLAGRDITAGEAVHAHNLNTDLKLHMEYSYEPQLFCCSGISQEPAEFSGYLRANGDVGVRNEIWIIPTVGCMNKQAESLARKAEALFKGKTDGIFAFPHPYGCSQLGEDHQTAQQILAGLVRHPNAAAVLVLGLGCENNNIPEFKKALGEYDPERVRFLNAQETEDELAAGMEVLEELVLYASGFKRQSCAASKLVVGLKCGGSDGFSGITANPLLGAFSDAHTGQGGTCILTEVPEMFGAETILMNRCIDRNIFDRTVKLINDFKSYFSKYGQQIYENPSPGNKAGGISTLEEKSLGAIQKGGTGCVTGVLDFGEKAAAPGLNLLKGPGNDLVSATLLASSGAQVILFATGRGTPFGSPVPTIKISSNTELYLKKKNWIDYDAGELLFQKDTGMIKADFHEFVLKVASGAIKTRNEANDCREIAIFKDGVTL